MELFVPPLSGIALFSQTLLEIGKVVPVKKKIRSKDVLPCSASVKFAISHKAINIPNNFRNRKLQDLLRLGGGATSNGLKDSQSGSRLYALSFTI